MPPDRESSLPSPTMPGPRSQAAEKRTRLACTACRAVKQRCDGPSRHPCRRCEQFSLECRYESTPRMTASAASARVKTGGHKSPSYPPTSTPSSSYPGSASMPLPSPNGSAYQPLPGPVTSMPSYPIASTSTAPYPYPSAPIAAVPAATPELVGILRDIAVRLGRLEDAVGVPGEQHDARRSRSPDMATQNYTHPAVDESPLSQVQSSVVRLNTLGDIAANAAPLTGAGEGDAVSRDIIDIRTAAELFEYYFTHLNATFPLADNDLDRDPSTVRLRNSLLFHTILLAAAYYVLLRTPSGRHAYRSLAMLVSDGLGRQLLFARARPGGQLNRDVVVAVLLCVVRKPIWTSHADETVAELPIARQCASKLNYDMGFLLVGLAARAQLLLGLNRVCDQLLQAVDSEGYLHPANVPSDDVVRSNRLWFHLCLVDAHGSISASRAPSLVTPNATRASSIFASLGSSPHDIWTAALMHLALLGREHFGRANAGADRAHDVEALGALNRSLTVWSGNWSNRIAETRNIPGRNIASLRYESVVAFCHGRFMQLSATATLVRRWEATGEPVAGEAEILLEALEAAKSLLRALAVDPMAEPLQPCPDIGQAFRAGPDNALTVILPFSALFLIKHAPYQRDTSTLVSLAAGFLDMASPHPTHPAVGHARILRTCLSPTMVSAPAGTADPSASPFTSLAAGATSFRSESPFPGGVSNGNNGTGTGDGFDPQSLLALLLPSSTGAGAGASAPPSSTGLAPLMELAGIDWSQWGFENDEGFGMV